MQGVRAVSTAAFAQAAVFAGAALLAGGAPRLASLAAGLLGALAVRMIVRGRRANFSEADFWALALAVAASFVSLLAFVLLHEIVAWPRAAAFFAAAVLAAPFACAAASTPGGVFAWLRANPAHWAPGAAFFAVAAALAAAGHYPTLYFDHWDLLALYEASARGALRLGDLFTPHGTHWHAGAYAVLLPLARLTHMAQWAEIAANLAFALAAGAALYALLAHSARQLAAAPRTALAFAIGAFFLFSADQIENWFWGWQAAVFINIAGALACIALLARPQANPGALCAAMLAAAAAIYSFATGLALLPIGFAVLLLARRRFDAHAALWLAFSCAVAAHYKFAVLDARPDYVREITPHALDGAALFGLA
ncbi:MAG: hypothetical protein AB7M12_04755, partial [Hyphomonadaceae bacterium]